MSDPLFDVHRALFTKLDTDVTADVYDYVPDKPSYPYVCIMQHSADRLDNLKENKSSITSYILVQSEYKGQKEIMEIMEQIYDSLHRTKLVLDTGRVVDMYIESRDTLRDVEEQLFEGRVLLRSLIEE